MPRQVSWRFPRLIAVDQSQIDALVRIHLQQEYRGAADVREADDSVGLDSEMIGPSTVSRMKQGHQGIAIRIAVGQVGSLALRQKACPVVARCGEWLDGVGSESPPPVAGFSARVREGKNPNGAGQIGVMNDERKPLHDKPPRAVLL